MLDPVESRLDLLFERYIARLANRGRRPQTIYNFTRAVTAFQDWLGRQDIAVADVGEDEIEAYFAPSRFPHSQGTRRMHAIQIRAAYAYGLRRGWVAADPFADFELPTLPNPDPDVVPSAELRAIRARCRNWKHETLWGLVVYTGMRRDELRRLTWEDVDLDALTISTVGKGDKPRVIPVHPELQKLIERAPDARARTDERVGAVLWAEQTRGHYSTPNSFERIKVPITDRGFHIFRRTVATSLFRNGVPGDTIDRILGWAPAGIRARYYLSVQADDLHRAILRLYRDDPLG